MSNRPEILVRVGAEFDRSFDAVMAEAERKAGRAFGTGRGGGGLSAAERAQIAAAQRIYDTESKLNRQIHAEQSKAALELAKLRMRLDANASRERQREARAQDSHVKAYYQNVIRENQRAEAAKRAESRKTATEIARNERAERQAAYRRDREIDRLATRTSHRATRFFFPPPEGALGFAKRTALDLARAAGVDVSLSGGFRRSVELEKAAQVLSQNAYQPGQAGPAGTQVAGSTISGSARDIASRYGLQGGSQEVVEGQAKFVSVTGDLETARAVSKDIATLSAATGVGFSEAMEAVSAISVKLGDVPDKAKVLYSLMRGFAWQGKLAAVEISDLATSMPRLISGVTRFEGDVGTNMQKLGVLAQMARGGPAGTAREAATGVARLADLLVTPTRVKAMKKVGLTNDDIFNKEGLIRDPFEIIKKALTITGGDPLKMRTAFASVMGSRPVERFADIYRGAGGGKAGLKAIDAETSRILSGSDVGMSAGMVEKLASQYAGTKAASAQRFQEALDRVTAAMGDRLFPVLERSGPMLTRFVGAMGDAVAWATENPGKAILAAITASIARAGLESVGRLIIDRVMTSFGGKMIGGGIGGIGGGGTGIGGGVIGGVSAGVMTAAGAAAMGYAAFTVTTALLDIANANLNQSGQNAARSSNDIYQQFARDYGNATSDEERGQIWKRAKYNLSEVEGSRGFMDKMFGDNDVVPRTLQAMADIARRLDTAREKRDDATQVANLNNQTPAYNTEIAAVVARELTGALRASPLNVRVNNVEEFRVTPEPVDWVNLNPPIRFGQ